jgi:serine/threonine-protein kinase
MDGTARLLDFGIAKTAAAAHVTRSGTFKGKLAYSAPEQLGGSVTRQTDLYALGVVLWELLAGKRMHAGRSDSEIYRAITQGKPPRITRALAKRRGAGQLDDATWAQLEALAPIVERMLARGLDHRFATAAEAEHALVSAVTPAPLADVAAWLRLHGQDLLDQTDQWIAAEEASWRLATGSGVVPAVKLPTSESRRASTSLPTQAAKPSLRAKHWHRAWLWRRARLWHRALARKLWAIPDVPVAIADALIVVVVLLVLVLAGAKRPHVAEAARLAPAAVRVPLPVTRPVFVAQPALAEPPPALVAAEGEENAKRAPVARRSVKQINKAKSRRRTDCSIPFYYEGSKKLFKPSCI